MKSSLEGIQAPDTDTDNSTQLNKIIYFKYIICLTLTDKSHVHSLPAACVSRISL